MKHRYNPVRKRMVRFCLIILALLVLCSTCFLSANTLNLRKQIESDFLVLTLDSSWNTQKAEQALENPYTPTPNVRAKTQILATQIIPVFILVDNQLVDSGIQFNPGMWMPVYADPIYILGLPVLQVVTDTPKSYFIPLDSVEIAKDS